MRGLGRAPGSFLSDSAVDVVDLRVGFDYSIKGLLAAPKRLCYVTLLSLHPRISLIMFEVYNACVVLYVHV